MGLRFVGADIIYYICKYLSTEDVIFLSRVSQNIHTVMVGMCASTRNFIHKRHSNINSYELIYNYSLMDKTYSILIMDYVVNSIPRV